ncbi:Disease resistance protein RPM1 [Hordeum vulgare]|nr:Disease resistance protein RPM1 [Hordeum vulgare]
MAEVAAGAVSSLLGVIRSEALLLRGVRDDVQFIKEEMESMKSFLAHLSRWAPPGGEHDEQVRTWMNQVRLLAQDCNNSIGLYLYRGNPDIHRARGGLRGYLWWATWFLHKLAAQHRAAEELRLLKERARDVGERRLRYGVEVPDKSVKEQSHPRTSSSSWAAAAGGYAAGDDDEEDGDGQLIRVTAASNHSARRAFTEPRTLDDYVREKLCKWSEGIPMNAGETLSMVVVAPYTYQEDLLILVQEIWVWSQNPVSSPYHRIIVVDIPAVHPHFAPLRPKEVLFYILRELKHAKSQPRDEGTEGQVEDKYLDPWSAYMTRRLQIYNEKKRVLALLKIKENIKEMRIYEKLDKIKSDIQGRLENASNKLQGDFDQLDLDVLLQLLLEAASQQDQRKNKDMPAWDKNSTIVKKLKEHMETKEENKKLQEIEAAKHMGVEEGEEAAVKHMEEGAGNVAIHREEEEGGRGGETTEHMKDGEGEVSRHREEDIEEGEEVTIHREEEEEQEEGGGEESQQTAWIQLDEAQYAHILRKLFPKSSSSKPMQAQDRSLDKQATKTTTVTMGEDQIKKLIHDAKEDILRELQQSKYDKSEETGEPGAPDQNPETVSERTFACFVDQMMEKMKHEFKEQLKIKGLVDEIKNNLDYHPFRKNYECPLFMLKVDELMDVSTCEDIRNALSLLNCSADLMIVTAAKDIQLAKEHCYPQLEPINYSLTGLYHDTVLELTSQQKNEDSYNPQIFHDILYECEPHEFCMKVFTHALYANPKRSAEELHKLHSTLQALPTPSFNSIAKVMFKFSYNDLPKEFKSCLLYLAIFSPGQKIRRSTLIARWVAEGLTSKEDWPSSVHQANCCFDKLIGRCFVDPADIDAMGNVKSCVVSDAVHGFITTIARKQHIVATRLSHHLARHFSIFNDLQLRSSDRIDQFFKGISKSSQVSLLKVLDLEDCRCFLEKKQRYLKEICSKMLLLKYLSLRRTNITQLPSEINNLRDLEVLDIRETKVPPHATTHILLLKLKRLLAGHIDPSNFESNPRIPHRIDKMVNMEVLSNVKAKQSHDLKDIGRLWQLRKLGVVIDDKDSHLRNLLKAISDLHECLCSLSITIPVATPSEDTPSAEVPYGIASLLKNNPKILESLSIRGTTQKGRLLPLFIKGDKKDLAKVTLCYTLLSQEDLEVLAKLPKLRFVKLQHIVCTEHVLNFKEGEFRCLKYLVVEGSDLTDITFKVGAASELEKMVLSITSICSISGVDHLPNLKELELNSSFCGSLLSSFDNATHIAKLTLCGTLLEQDALQLLTKKSNIRSLVLLDKSFTGSQNEITLKKDEFLWLNLLVVDCSAITKIVFDSGCAPRLEKIVWSSSTSLSGIDKLPRLKDLEFKGDQVLPEVREAIENHKNKPSFKFSGQEIPG